MKRGRERWGGGPLLVHTMADGVNHAWCGGPLLVHTTRIAVVYTKSGL